MTETNSKVICWQSQFLCTAETVDMPRISRLKKLKVTKINNGVKQRELHNNLSVICTSISTLHHFRDIITCLA